MEWEMVRVGIVRGLELSGYLNEKPFGYPVVTAAREFVAVLR